MGGKVVDWRKRCPGIDYFDRRGALPGVCRVSLKIRYASRARAKAAIRRTTGSGDYRPPPARPHEVLNAYSCRHCECWHIGHAAKAPVH